ncbi:MAG: peptide chain release factor 1 [Candidatus Altiarchaeales archaeon]|nr:MAG: peptide chain release factor 1 [Candidatus Altiarchaeales archaeon]
MEAKDEYKLRRLVNELKRRKGRHTELISIYIPAGYDINNVLNQLVDEQGTAANIKSKSTRKNVLDALEKTIQHLRLFKKTPDNGLVVFCGNVSEKEGVQDLRLWSIEPPEPISVRIYRCDQEFVIEPLEEIIKPKDVYGLIAIDNKEATIATLKGNRYTILKHLTSGYTGKHRAGGQSHRRFERLIREQSHEFKVRVGEHSNKIFLENFKDLKGIIIGGPAGTKDDFVEGNYLNHELKKKIIAVQDITYTDESGIRELIDKSKDVLSNVQMVRHKTHMQRFLKGLVSSQESVAYGDDVDKALDMGAVDILLISENLDDETIDKLYQKAKDTNTEVDIVSDDFEEGFQLWNTFGGKAAILRFKVE